MSMEFGFTHAGHATATFLEVSIAVSALSLRVLAHIDNTVGPVDDVTLEAAEQNNDLNGYRDAAERRRVRRIAYTTLTAAILCLLGLGCVHFDNSDAWYLGISLVICIASLIIIYISEIAKMKSGKQPGVTAKNTARKAAARFAEKPQHDEGPQGE